jgi:peroxiredoxin (alkyl hydroperoxide reductase subunit C)
MTVGRSIEEMVRMLAALQRSADGTVLTPAGWQPGEDVLVPPGDMVGAALGEDAPADWFHQTRADR